jgi:hypothetical protein
MDKPDTRANGVIKEINVTASVVRLTGIRFEGDGLQPIRKWKQTGRGLGCRWNASRMVFWLLLSLIRGLISDALH